VAEVGPLSEGCVPVCSKDRLKVIATSAAAMLIAAASVSAWAQSASPEDAGAQTSPPEQAQEQPDQQVLDQQGLGLRGADQPSLETEGSPLQDDAQEPSDVNPIAVPEPQYGLPSPISDTSDYINYGKAKPKKSKLYQLPKLTQPGGLKLPPLTTYKTAPDTQRRGSNPPYYDPSNPGPTNAVIQPLLRPLPPKPDPAPFAPVGIDVGSLRLYPYVEADTGYESNPNFLSSDVVGSLYAHGEVGLRAESLWSQHSLTADLRGGYYDYFGVPLANRPDAAGTVTGRIDVTRQTQINLVSTFAVTTQQPGSPILAVPNSVFITNRPLVVSLGQSIGVAQQFNRLSVSLTGAFTSYIFGNAEQSDGTELLLSQNDYNDYALIGRASYELVPSLIPFVQVTGDARRYDVGLDVDGFARSSNGIAGELGSTLEFSRLLTGEIGVGYADRVYVDPRLPVLDAPTIDAKLIYAATPLTTVNLTAATYLSETTLAYASGAVSRSVSLNVTHALARDLTISATASYQNNVYDGSPIFEQLYTGVLKVDYNLSREIVLTGSVTHQQFLSTAQGGSYTDNIFLLGLRLQD
jgi:hypothetical protein